MIILLDYSKVSYEIVYRLVVHQYLDDAKCCYLYDLMKVQNHAIREPEHLKN